MTFEKSLRALEEMGRETRETAEAFGERNRFWLARPATASTSLSIHTQQNAAEVAAAKLRAMGVNAHVTRDWTERAGPTRPADAVALDEVLAAAPKAPEGRQYYRVVVTAKRNAQDVYSYVHHKKVKAAKVARVVSQTAQDIADHESRSGMPYSVVESDCHAVVCVGTDGIRNIFVVTAA